MNWKPTWLLLALAGLLFAFIYLVERRAGSTSLAKEPAPRLLSIRPEEVSGITLDRVDGTNRVVIWVEKTNQVWNLTLPFYPAQIYSIETFLQSLAALTSQALITPQELAANHRSLADYGLKVPVATLSLHHGGQRTEILFGSRTPVGDHVYVQLMNKPGIYVVQADVFDRLPHTVNDWRDTSLLNLVGLSLDRMEVRAPGKTFAIQENQTNHTFYLSKPQSVRASEPKVKALLQQLQSPEARVLQFVTDDPRVELEPLGLQPPEAELAFGAGTNDVVVVQFGKSPPNDPTVVYARRLTQTNIVLVSRSILEAVLTPHTDLRDRHLVSFPPEELDTIEVMGVEKFTLRRQTNGTWLVTEPQVAAVDAEVMRDWLDKLERLEGNVEKDVVTDLASYALTTPARQYVFKGSITNADGTINYRLFTQLEIGGRRDDKIFARRADENSVYWITTNDFSRLPAAAWQLRDRRVWSFTTNQISRVSVRHRGYTRQWDRSGNGQWRFAPGSQGILDDRQFALEETMYRLGQLRASIWVARGDDNRPRYGFSDEGYKMTIELKNGEKASTLNLEFSDWTAPSQYHYAITTIDGQSWIFEFPLGLFLQVTRDFSNPPARTAAAAGSP